MPLILMVSSSCSTVVRLTHYSGRRAQLRLMPHCTRRHLIPPPLLQGRGLEVLLKDEIIQQGEDLLWFLPNFHSSPLYDELLRAVAAIWCIAMSCSCCCYMMNCYELLLLHDELLWAVAAIWWVAISCSCCCYMMNCYELLLLLLYDELLWAAAGIWWIAHCCCCCMMSCYELLLYDAFGWCCCMIITSHFDHRNLINNGSTFKFIHAFFV